MSDVSHDTNDLFAFVEAIEQAFPFKPARDRFGRTLDGRNTSKLQDLAAKYQVGGCYNIEEQAGAVARAILKKMGGANV
jgi:hypothetical protein